MSVDGAKLATKIVTDRVTVFDTVTCSERNETSRVSLFEAKVFESLDVLGDPRAFPGNAAGLRSSYCAAELRFSVGECRPSY